MRSLLQPYPHSHKVKQFEHGLFSFLAHFAKFKVYDETNNSNKNPANQLEYFRHINLL